jgi:hypothetical protein
MSLQITSFTVDAFKNKRVLAFCLGCGTTAISSWQLRNIIADNQPLGQQEIAFKATTFGIGSGVSLMLNSLPPYKHIRQWISDHSLEIYFATTLCFLNTVPFYPQTIPYFLSAYYAFCGKQLISDLTTIKAQRLEIAEVPLNAPRIHPFGPEEKYRLINSIIAHILIAIPPIITAAVFPKLEILYSVSAFLIGSGAIGAPLEKWHHFIIKKIENKVYQQYGEEILLDGKEAKLPLRYQLLKIVPKIIKAFNGFAISASLVGLALLKNSPFKAFLMIVPGIIYGALRSDERRGILRIHEPELQKTRWVYCCSAEYFNREPWKIRSVIDQVSKVVLFVSCTTLFGLGLSPIPEVHSDMRNNIAWGTFTFSLPLTYFLCKEIDARQLLNRSNIINKIHFELVKFPLIFTYFFLLCTSFMKIGDESLNEDSLFKYIFVLSIWFIYGLIFTSNRTNRENVLSLADAVQTNLIAQVFLANQLLTY